MLLVWLETEILQGTWKKTRYSKPYCSQPSALIQDHVTSHVSMTTKKKGNLRHSRTDCFQLNDRACDCACHHSVTVVCHPVTVVTTCHAVAPRHSHFLNVGQYRELCEMCSCNTEHITQNPPHGTPCTELPWPNSSPRTSRAAAAAITLKEERTYGHGWAAKPSSPSCSSLRRHTSM